MGERQEQARPIRWARQTTVRACHSDWPSCAHAATGPHLGVDYEWWCDDPSCPAVVQARKTLHLENPRHRGHVGSLE